MSHAIGIIELSSIAAGYQAQDAMLKAADVAPLVARTICSGKFLIIIGGTVSAVGAALGAGEADAAGFLIESLNIPNVDPQVFTAISGNVDLTGRDHRSLGIVETFSATPIIEAADAAVKAADVVLLRVHVSMAIGGKGFMLVNGDTAAVNAAVEAACDIVGDSGMLVNRVVIPSASPELLKEYI
ncbi:MAG: BMC domain-containing protein [Desulfobacter sp.]